MRILWKSLGIVLVTLIAIAIAEAPAFAEKIDKKIYSKFKLVYSENTQIGTIHKAKKKEVLFSTPVEALEMVEITSPATFKGLGKTLGIAGPKVSYEIDQGAKFYKVFSAVYEHIYCEVGRYEYFDSCLIDTDGDSYFDLGANKVTSKGSGGFLLAFTPAKIAHEIELDKKVPYIQTSKRMPVEYVVRYTFGSKKPRLTAVLFDREKAASSWWVHNPAYSKKAKTPYVLEVGVLKLKVTLVENKEITVEIIQGVDENSIFQVIN